jgi:hypothetical protein
MQQVGGYLGYTGRAANVIAKAARDHSSRVLACETSSHEPMSSACVR